MVKRWVAQFGLEATREFLKWNQSEPSLFVRKIRDLDCEENFLEATEWAHFYKLQSGAWKEIEMGLAEGRYYIQNPATSRSVGLLAKSIEGGRVLDVCSAPGGKTLLLDACLPEAVKEVISLDLPGPRIDRLRAVCNRPFEPNASPLSASSPIIATRPNSNWPNHSAS